ncbi:hypothetical protein GCM10009682_29880 [Luedemannella flava]|uniref:Lipoprotein n=2 Tax=Luedemannella flava TaxID=349316 RepID=A0ABN2M143_9ACTN
MHRRSFTTAAVGLGLALALAACGPADDNAGGAAPTTAPASPKDTLIAAAPASSGKSFSFTSTGAGAKGSGRVDPASKGNDLSFAYTDAELGFTMDMKFLVVDADAWVKITFENTDGLTGLPKYPKKWMHLDKSKVTDTDGEYIFDPDPLSTSSVLKAIVSAEKAGEGDYSGTLDLTAAPDATIVDEEVLKDLGDAAKAVPFTATIGADGHLATLTVKVPKAGKNKAYTYTEKYADYGTAKPVSAPAAGDAQEAPDSAYEMLNS